MCHTIVLCMHSSFLYLLAVVVECFFLHWVSHLCLLCSLFCSHSIADEPKADVLLRLLFISHYKWTLVSFDLEIYFFWRDPSSCEWLWCSARQSIVQSIETVCGIQRHKICDAWSALGKWVNWMKLSAVHAKSQVCVRARAFIYYAI